MMSKAGRGAGVAHDTNTIAEVCMPRYEVQDEDAEDPDEDDEDLDDEDDEDDEEDDDEDDDTETWQV